MADVSRQRRQRRSFSDEYKAEVVKKCEQAQKDGRSIGQVARELDLTETSVREWVMRAKADAGRGKPGVLTSSERDELTALRKRVRELEMDRDILKKAAAFFAKESK